MKKDNVFNGKRLRDARIYRGKSISDLADEINISRQAISQFENESIKISPSMEVIFKIATSLRFPVQYFYEEDLNNINVYNTYFRALASSNKRDRLMEKNKTEKVALLYQFLSEYLDFPQLRIIQTNDYRYEDIENIASMLREKWKLGQEPILDIVNQMERNGIIVSSFKTDKNNIDAFSQLSEFGDKEFYCVILGNDKNSATRRQFNAAHELGHIVLHDWKCDLEDLTKEEFRKREDEANYFAATFLLPKEAFLKDLLYEKDLNFYIKLKKKWRVSISAMVIRAYQLETLSTNQYQYLMRKMSQLGWRNNEPLDDTLKIEEPILFKKAIEIILDNNILTKSEIMEKLSARGLGLNVEDIEDLLCLEPNTLLDIKKENNIKDFICIKKSRGNL